MEDIESDTNKIKRLIGLPRDLTALISECRALIRTKGPDSEIEDCLLNIKQKAAADTAQSDIAWDQIADFLKSEDKSISMLFIILPVSSTEQDPFETNPYCRTCDPFNHENFESYYVKRKLNVKDRRVFYTRLSGFEIERLFYYIDRKTKSNKYEGLVVCKSLRAMRIIRDRIFCEIKYQVLDFVLSKVFGPSDHGMLELKCDYCRSTKA
jgi:hypothetical protein